jgi:hypothetical protein
VSWDSAIKWIMLVSGALTCTLVSAAFTPAETLRSIFGAWPESAETDLVARNWGILIGLMGALLVYGAFHPAVRKTALVVAGASKAVFVALVLAQGSRLLSHQAGIAVAVDSVWVHHFAAYLWSSRPRRATAIR